MDEDKFWDAVEEIACDYRGNPDDADALRRLKKLECDDATAKEILEAWKP